MFDIDILYYFIRKVKNIFFYSFDNPQFSFFDSGNRFKVSVSHFAMRYPEVKRGFGLPAGTSNKQKSHLVYTDALLATSNSNIWLWPEGDKMLFGE